MRRELHHRPDGKREHEREQQVELHDLLHAVRAFRAAGVAEDGLRALRQTGQRQLHHLRHRGEDGHRADRRIAAVFLQRHVERDGEQAFGGLHDERRSAEADRRAKERPVNAEIRAF